MIKGNDNSEDQTESLGFGEIRSVDPSRLPSPTPLPNIPLDDDLPDSFGKYVFKKRIGSGGFGEVFLIERADRLRFEALKMIRPERIGNKDTAVRFQREQQSLADLTHGNIAQIYDCGFNPYGHAYFTMEFIPDGRIDDYCDRQRLTIRERVELMVDICSAVEHAHRSGIIHRDIKPGNILIRIVDGAPVPKLVDFGFAHELKRTDDPLTHDGEVFGTPPTMCPEQAEDSSEGAKPCWDVYALGATLYRLLVGDYPIGGIPSNIPRSKIAEYIRNYPCPSPSDRLSSMARGAEQIATARRVHTRILRRELKANGLDRIVMRAIAKNSDARYSSARELGDDLRLYLDGNLPSVVSSPIRRSWRKHRGKIVIGLAGAILATLTATSLVLHQRSRHASVQALLAEARSVSDPHTAISLYEHALQLDRDRFDIRLLLASAWVAAGSREQAAIAVQVIPKDHPNYADAQAMLSALEQMRHLNRPRGTEDVTVSPGSEYYYALALSPDEAKLAVALLNKALKRSTKHDERFSIRLARAWRYLQLRDFVAAETDAKILVELESASSTAWNVLGLARWKQGRLNEALLAYGEAIQRKPDAARTLISRAGVYNDLGAWDTALRDCTHALEINPDLGPEAMPTRIRALLETDQTLARSECEGLNNQPVVYPETYMQCGEVWREIGNLDRARIAYDHALKLARTDSTVDDEWESQAYSMRAVVANRQQNYEAAIADFDIAETLQPDLWDPRGRFRLSRGMAKMLTGKHESAIPDLSKVASQKRNGADAAQLLLWIWDIHLERNDGAKAAIALKAAHTAAEGDPWASMLVTCCERGVAESTLLQDVTGARRQCEAYYYLGLGAKARGRFSDALVWFEKCTDFDAAVAAESELAAMQLSTMRTTQDEAPPN